MSMAVHTNNAHRFGGCIAYGPPFGFGLPIDVPEGRPLVMAHPAAAMHHHASFGLVSDAGHPFIHVMVDHGEYAPDGWSINASEAGMAPWQRIPDTTKGHKTYRKAALSVPHWQVHVPGEAFSTLSTLPPVDILYLDWLAWLDPHGLKPNTNFDNIIAAYVHKIREGGLVVLDHKHIDMSEGNHPWFCNVHDEFVHLDNGSLLANKGVVEWMSPDLYGDYQSHMATVFHVHHGIEGPLSNKDWEGALQPWYWMTIPEVSMSPTAVKKMLIDKAEPATHPDAPTQEEWMQDWLRYHDEHEPGPMVLGPTPPSHAWPSGAYPNFLKWLLKHPTMLLGDYPKTTYRLLGEAFKLHIVHGDLLRLAPALFGSKSVLAVRAKLSERIVARCPRWLGHSLELQSPFSWERNPIQGLQWSGPKATPMLAKTMLELSLSQSGSGSYPSLKTMAVNHIVTISHGTASLGEVMNAVIAYYDGLPPMMGRLPRAMTIVCLDEEDYTDVHTVPHRFQFLPDDGPCTD